jgi:hypothetical protein
MEPMSKNNELHRWVISDECGNPVASCRAATREKAIEAFCYPALRADAYFSTEGGWTCDQAHNSWLEIAEREGIDPL